MTIPQIYSYSLGSQNKVYVAQGPLTTGAALSSGQFFSGNYALIKKDDKFYLQNFGAEISAGELNINNASLLNIEPIKGSSFYSFSFDNSGRYALAEEKDGITHLRLHPYSSAYSFSLRNPILLNTVNINQPFTGVDISGTIFRTGELVCFGKSGNDLVGYFQRNNFAYGTVLNSGLLADKDLFYGCFNRREYQTQTYHPFSILFFANSGNKTLCLETKYATKLGHHLFNEYPSLTSGTGAFEGGWGYVGNPFNSLNPISFTTRLQGYYNRTALSGSQSFQTGSFQISGQEVSRQIEFSSYPFVVRSAFQGYYNYLTFLASDFFTGTTGISGIERTNQIDFNSYIFDVRTSFRGYYTHLDFNTTGLFSGSFGISGAECARERDFQDVLFYIKTD